MTLWQLKANFTCISDVLWNRPCAVRHPDDRFPSPYPRQAASALSISGLRRSRLFFSSSSDAPLSRENIHIAFANGVSRRTHFLSFLIFRCLPAVTAIFGVAADAVPQPVSPRRGALIQRRAWNSVPVLLALNMALMALGGYFIAGAYYRMNKAARWIVSLCVPAALIVLAVLP